MTDADLICHHCQGLATYGAYTDCFVCTACGSAWALTPERTDFYMSAKAMELGFARYNKHLREKINEDLLKLGDP